MMTIRQRVCCTALSKPLIVAIMLMLALMAAAGCVGSSNQENPSTATQPAQTATAPPNTPVLYKFAVCGDNRTLGIDNGVLPRILDSAKASGAQFMVNTGDVSNSGTTEELRRYKELIDGSGLKVYTAPGNHDIGAGGRSDAYASVMGDYYFSFDYQADHFIVLDNADDKTGIDNAQMDWFEGDLAVNATRPHQFIFTHVPVPDPSLPSSHVAGETGQTGLESGKRLVEDAKKYPDVSGIFFGHIHAYFAYQLDGISAYITGGAGAPLYFPEGSGGYFHYLLVSVRADRVDVEVVRV